MKEERVHILAYASYGKESLISSREKMVIHITSNRKHTGYRQDDFFINETRCIRRHTNMEVTRVSYHGDWCLPYFWKSGNNEWKIIR